MWFSTLTLHVSFAVIITHRQNDTFEFFSWTYAAEIVWSLDGGVPPGLDGSTSAMEREKLINQFNDPDNTAIHVFLLSTRYALSTVGLVNGLCLRFTGRCAIRIVSIYM